MELNDVAKKIQEYLVDSPLIVLGSGASVPYGLPTMEVLASELMNNPVLVTSAVRSLEINIPFL